MKIIGLILFQSFLSLGSVSQESCFNQGSSLSDDDMFLVSGNHSESVSGSAFTQLHSYSIIDSERESIPAFSCIDNNNLTEEFLLQGPFRRVLGGIIQGDSSQKKIALVFTGHEFADGGETISRTLKKEKVKGSFFLTGDFYRLFPALVNQLQKEGHYLGAHSDKHLLYADWGKRDSTLVTREAFRKDLQDNYQTMTKAGINPPVKKFFLPAYEWYNQDVSNWCTELGVQLINFTPGTTSNADYTVPQMKNYRSSEEIYRNIMNYELKHTLNGFMLLIHIGTDSKRTDKLYDILDELIDALKSKGYEFVRVDELLK
ncbi:polysaccharide deacetylase family protein [Bacteroides sedimenti]|uniref:polysaccharide deacetylase family protein n=1 Tax=Bacteroides sedimenti TaxID=2136147 RepID=UPI003341BC66